MNRDRLAFAVVAASVCVFVALELYSANKAEALSNPNTGGRNFVQVARSVAVPLASTGERCTATVDNARDAVPVYTGYTQSTVCTTGLAVCGTATPASECLGKAITRDTTPGQLFIGICYVDGGPLHDAGCYDAGAAPHLRCPYTVDAGAIPVRIELGTGCLP